MKLKLIQKGYESFEGMLGPVLFSEGVSVEGVSFAEARLISAVIAAVNAEDDSPVSEMQHIIDNYRTEAPSERLPTHKELREQGVSLIASLMSPPTEQSASSPAPAAPAVRIYSKEELEAVADQSGIAGLRAIGEPIDARAKNVAALIASILQAQGNAPEVAKFIEAPAAPDAPVTPVSTPDTGSE